MSILEVRDLTKGFFIGLDVVKNTNFSLNSGEIVGIVGLNGAGKTTVIKLILGLISSDFGCVSIFGVDSRVDKSRQNVFYVPEKFSPPKNLKVNECVKFYNSFFNHSVLEDQILNVCEKIDLNPKYLDYKISDLSKGTVQKVGLLCAFTSKRKILILDEPMDGLDVRARVALKNTIKDYVKNGGTILFSSHILSDMEEICDRICFFDNASFAFSGKVCDLKLQFENKTLEQIFLEKTNNS